MRRKLRNCGTSSGALALSLLVLALGFGRVNSRPLGDQERSTDEHVKILEAAINDSIFEAGKKGDPKYEIYKYDELRLVDCSLRWLSTHEVYEGDKRTLSEVRNITAPLSLIDINSVRSHKIANPGYLVSLTTRGLQLGIIERVQTVHGDNDALKSTGRGTGDGFYFSERQTAQTVARALVALIRSCDRGRNAKLVRSRNL